MRSAAPIARMQKAANAADRQESAMKLAQELLQGLEVPRLLLSGPSRSLSDTVYNKKNLLFYCSYKLKLCQVMPGEQVSPRDGVACFGVPFSENFLGGLWILGTMVRMRASPSTDRNGRSCATLGFLGHPWELPTRPTEAVRGPGGGAEASCRSGVALR